MRADGFGADINRDVRSLWAATVLAPGIIWIARALVASVLELDR